MSVSIRLILMACLVLFRAEDSLAATAAAKEDAIDISAEESLEWYRDQKLYVARGQARAVRGAMTVEADILTAKQKDGAAGKNETADIAFLTAEGNVKITDPRQQVFGTKAVYDLDKRTIVITGPGLKYITAGDVVTARDSLEYAEDTDTAVAKGRALADHDGNRIEADVLTAYFKPDAAGQKSLDHITAKGRVIVVTRDGGVSKGEKGYYDAKKETAYLMDHVRITRGATELAGDKAEVNFATGQSRLLNSGSGRVRALLPSSGTKKEGKK